MSDMIGNMFMMKICYGNIIYFFQLFINRFRYKSSCGYFLQPNIYFATIPVVIVFYTIYIKMDIPDLEESKTYTYIFVI